MQYYYYRNKQTKRNTTNTCSYLALNNTETYPHWTNEHVTYLSVLFHLNPDRVTRDAGRCIPDVSLGHAHKVNNTVNWKILYCTFKLRKKPTIRGDQQAAAWNHAATFPLLSDILFPARFGVGGTPVNLIQVNNYDSTVHVEWVQSAQEKISPWVQSTAAPRFLRSVIPSFFFTIENLTDNQRTPGSINC